MSHTPCPIYDLVENSSECAFLEAKMEGEKTHVIAIQTRGVEPRAASEWFLNRGTMQRGRVPYTMSDLWPG
jgi:hypothetical protein